MANNNANRDRFSTKIAVYFWPAKAERLAGGFFRAAPGPGRISGKSFEALSAAERADSGQTRLARTRPPAIHLRSAVRPAVFVIFVNSSGLIQGAGCHGRRSNGCSTTNFVDGPDVRWGFGI